MERREHGTFYKGKHSFEVTYSIIDLFHYHHGGTRQHEGGRGTGIESFAS